MSFCYAVQREVSLVDGSGSVGLIFDIKQGVILGRNSDSYESSGRTGSVNPRPAVYLGGKHVGYAYPLRRDSGCWVSATPRCPPAQCSTPPIRFVGIGIFPFPQHPYHTLIPIVGSAR